ATMQRHFTPVLALAFSADGKTLTSAGADGSVLVWDVTKKKQKRALQLGPTVLAVAAFSPDGETLAATLARLAGPGGAPDAVMLWDLKSGKPRGPLTGHEFSTVRLAFAPGGKTLATTGLRQRTPADGPPDRRGGFLIQETRAWDVATGAAGGPVDGGLPLALGPDGQLLLGSPYDWVAKKHAVDVWDVARWTRRLTVAAPGGGATALAFAPDGKTFAAAGATVHVRDARTGKLLANLAGPRAPVAHLLFARDGR